MASLYVGCSLSQAPLDFRHEVEAFKDGLRERYEVFDFVGLEAGTATDVYNWDIENCTKSADLLVAVLDYPSIGLGYELSARLRDFKKPALGLVSAEVEPTLTRLVKGIPHSIFSLKTYGSLLVDAPEFVDEAMIELVEPAA